jgi:hypothetical protein
VRSLVLVLAACHGAPVAPPVEVVEFPKPRPLPELTATDYVRHLERIALSRLPGEISPQLAYRIRTAHERCTPILEEVPGTSLFRDASPTSTLVIGRCHEQGMSHPSPGIECVPPRFKAVFHVLVDRDARGFRVVQSQ